MNGFCDAGFLEYYTPEYKSNKICEYQPDKLDDNLIENNNEQCYFPDKTKLTISGEKNAISSNKINPSISISCTKYILFPKKLPHHVLLFFNKIFFFFIDWYTKLSSKLKLKNIQLILTYIEKSLQLKWKLLIC